MKLGLNLGLSAKASGGGGGGSTIATFQVSSADISAALTGYPVILDLSAIGAGWWADVATTDGADITAKVGGVQVPMDIISIDTGAQTGLVAVLADLSDSVTTSITLTAENDSGATLPAASDPLGSQAVWAAYEAVYLLDGNLNDRTANGRNLTIVEGSATYMTGQSYGVGRGLDTSGGAFKATSSGNTDILNVAPATWMAAAQQTVANSSNQQVFGTLGAAGSNINRAGVGEDAATSRWAGFSNDGGGFLTTSRAISTASIIHATYDSSRDFGTGFRVHLDGSFAVQETSAGTDLSVVIMLGALEGASDSSWLGYIWMASLMSVAASDAWIAADGKNWNRGVGLAAYVGLS